MASRSLSIPRLLSLSAAVACGAHALADALPTFPGVVHIDPFIPGWFPLGGPFNVVVPPGGAFIAAGVDGLASPALHVDEYQLDFVGLVGPINVSVNGGPSVPVLFGPGPDIYLWNAHPDFPAELGPTMRTLGNAGAVPVAFGVSVVENPNNPHQQPGGMFQWPLPGGGMGSAPIPPPFGTIAQIFVSRGPGQWNVTFTPPPPPCEGDANGDGRVDFADLNVVLSQFRLMGPSLTGDLNGDGRVDFFDLNVVLSNFGEEC